MFPYLYADELAEVTGRTRWSTQLRIMREMGLPVEVRADGWPLVLRTRLEDALNPRAARIYRRNPRMAQAMDERNEREAASAGAPAMFLSAVELRALTGKERKDAQVRALRAMGIEHRVRPDGHPVVLRSHVETELGGQPLRRAPKRRVEPNWDGAA